MGGTCVLDGSTVEGCGRGAVVVNGGEATVQRSKLVKCGLNALYAHNGARVTVEDSLLADCAYSNLDLVSASATVRRCELMNSGKCGACVAGGSQLDAEATVFYGNTLP